MTTPEPRTPQQQQLDQVAIHDAQAQLVEAALIAATAGLLLANVFGAIGMAKRRWIRLFGNLSDRQSGPEYRRAVRRLADELSRTRPGMAEKIQAGLDAARKLGVEQAYREASEPAVIVKVAAASGDILDVVRTAEGQSSRASQSLLYTFGGDWSTVESYARHARTAASGLVAHVATAFNTNLNKGIEDAAADMGARLVWIAERDACATCLALSGQVVSPGESFDMAATFAKAATTWAPPDGLLLTPPRHPHCRCRVSPYFGMDGPGLSFPDALRREAQRSILRGTRRPTESETVRLDAADRLLNRIASHNPRLYAWHVPKSVQERATRAVKRGHFPTP